MKYKSCCSGRCLLFHCETRESGGCYCICRLVDAINSCQSVINGDSFKMGTIYIPPGEFRDKYISTLDKEEWDDDRKRAALSLEIFQKKLKEYEIN